MFVPGRNNLKRVKSETDSVISDKPPEASSMPHGLAESGYRPTSMRVYSPNNSASPALVSDPGYRLVGEVRAAGHAVHAVPGPSAAIAALSVAGLPTDAFFFAGFLPQKAGARRARLAALAGVPGTLVFYEAPHRLAAALADLAEVLGDRQGAVARELTKRFETVETGTLGELAARYAADDTKGEIVLLVAPPGEGEADEDAARALLAEALKTMPASAAAADVARRTGRNRRALYALAMTLKEEAEAAPADPDRPDEG